MSALSEAITKILRPDAERTSADVDGLRLITWRTTPVVNVNTIAPHRRELTRADIDAVRAALTEAGYVAVDSWVASQGVSWLSDGVFAGVSFRVRRRPAPLVSDATIAEAAAMEERDRLAGGPPWEVPDHPENFRPGGWHHGQITGTPAPGWS